MTYCFLDIETTGLDPLRDKILEISWMFTDDQFNVTYMPRTFLVDQEDWQGTWHKLNSNMVVYNMHAMTGLLAALANDDTEKTTLDDIYDRLNSDLKRESINGVIHLAGRSVHFDKSFLIANSFHALFDDSLKDSFHHRMLDLSAVNLMLASAGVDIEHLQIINSLPHRAMHDIMADVQYAKNLRELLAEGIYV